MGSAFHQLCPRYSGTLTPTAPTAIRLWETFTLYLMFSPVLSSYCKLERSVTLLYGLSSVCLTCHECVGPVTREYVVCSEYTVKLQWLKHLSDHENMFETGVVQANEC